MKKLFFALCALVFCSVSAFAADNVLSDEEKADGFQLIFNGQNLDGWRGDMTRRKPLSPERLQELHHPLRFPGSA